MKTRFSEFHSTKLFLFVYGGFKFRFLEKCVTKIVFHIIGYYLSLEERFFMFEVGVRNQNYQLKELISVLVHVVL